MPPPETFERDQKAVRWPKVGVDRNAQDIVGDPEEIDVRWEDKGSRVLTPQGRTVRVDATVVLDFRATIGDLFFLGTLDDVGRIRADGFQGPARGIPGVCQAVIVDSAPDLRGVEYRNTAMLARLSDRINKGS